MWLLLDMAHKRRPINRRCECGLSADIADRPIIDAGEALQGKAAGGAQVTSNSGKPGAGLSIRIRGSSSISAGNDPLYIVDGIPTTEAILRSGAEIVTVALRRVDLTPGKPNVLDTIDRTRHTILPNTAGCYTAEEAIRTCRLARELGIADLVKLEVIGDERTLFPDGAATLEAARVLVKEGFTVLPYCMDDPILARKLEDVGCAAVMPLAAPIGSGLGIRNPYNLRIILEHAKVPIIVDAGVGTASDAAVAMELGCARRADEHRHRGRARSADDGRGDARRGHRRAQRLPGRPHPAQAVRDGVVAGRRPRLTRRRRAPRAAALSDHRPARDGGRPLADVVAAALRGVAASGLAAATASPCSSARRISPAAR